jgi:hypothetical protein
MSTFAIVPGVVTPVSSTGDSDGSIGVSTLVNGSGNYTYEWTNVSSDQRYSPSQTGLSAGIYTLTVVDNTYETSAQHEFTVTEPPAASFTIVPGLISAVTKVGGSNGSIQPSTIIDGSGDYSYTWSDIVEESSRHLPGLDNLPAGTYVLTVTDNGLLETKTHTFTVAEPEPIIVQVAGTIAPGAFERSECSISAPVCTGGSGDLFFRWRDDVSVTTPSRVDLEPGLYTLYITDSVESSLAVQTYNVEEYAPIDIASLAQITHVQLRGAATGAISSTGVTGGSGEYVFEWSSSSSTSNSLSALAAGDYTLTIGDLADSDPVSITYTVLEPTTITVVEPGTVVPSNGDEGVGSIGIPLMSGGDGFYSYTWSDDPEIATPYRIGLASGQYTLTVFDFVDNVPAEVTYTVPRYPAVQIVTPGTAFPTSLASNTGMITPATVSGGNGSFMYKWSDLAHPHLTSERLGLASGRYTLTVTSLEDGVQAVHEFIVQKEKPRRHARYLRRDRFFL